MGSRAVVLVCRDAAAPASGSGADGATGALYTRTGRPFFDDAASTEELLGPGARRGRPRPASGTSWTPTGCCSTASCCPGRPRPAGCCASSTRRSARPPAAALPGGAVARWTRAAARGLDVGDLLRPRSATGRPTPRRSPDGVPALLLADRRAGRGAAGAVRGAGRRRGVSYADRDARLAPGAGRPARGAARPGLLHAHPAAGRRHWPTRRRCAAATDWWLELTGRRRRGHGGQAVRRPGARDGKGRLVQPGIKCRGREYLRIIYGPDYTEPGEPGAAARRGPWATSGRWRCASTRSAWRRWTGWREGEPLWRVHELVFAVLAWSPNRSTPGCEIPAAYPAGRPSAIRMQRWAGGLRPARPTAADTGPDGGSAMGFHVDSEAGRLRRVILHRPDLELKRLTPTNKDALLFDDVLWVRRARAGARRVRRRAARPRGRGASLRRPAARDPGRSRRPGRSSWTGSSTRRSTARSPPTTSARSSTSCRPPTWWRRWSAA